MKSRKKKSSNKVLVVTLLVGGALTAGSTLYFLGDYSKSQNVLGLHTNYFRHRTQQPKSYLPGTPQQLLTLPTSSPQQNNLQSRLSAFSKPVRTTIRATAVVGNDPKKNLKQADRAIFTTRFQNKTGQDLKNVQLVFHNKGDVKFTMGAVKNARLDRTVQSQKGYLTFSLGDVKKDQGKAATFFVVGRNPGVLSLSSEVRTPQGLVDKMNPVTITVR